MTVFMHVFFNTNRQASVSLNLGPKPEVEDNKIENKKTQTDVPLSTTSILETIPTESKAKEGKLF